MSYNMHSSGGYGNEDRGDGPPRNVLSNETIRAALARANSAGSGKPMTSPSRTNSSFSNQTSQSRRSSSSTKRQPKHENCDCMDCVDLSYRDTHGTTRKDKNGDTVTEFNGSSTARVHCHVQPGLFDDENERPSAPRRTSTGGSSRSSKSSKSGSRRDSSQRTYTKNKDGDIVEEWNGSDAPGIRTHIDHNDPEFRDLKDDVRY
ncbi:hypothetical protein K440DRAFT_637730 [Wilcoxina mikolae CBS 423.85]|nr:hypothetical protein K440DRAFT_637730 [Wilcoxina mikolae CBS 423.85]